MRIAMENITSTQDDIDNLIQGRDLESHEGMSWNNAAIVSNSTALEGNSTNSSAQELPVVADEQPSLFSGLSTTSHVTFNSERPASSVSSPIHPTGFSSSSSSQVATVAPPASSPSTPKVLPARRRSARFADGGMSILARGDIPQVEKDGDHPKIPMDPHSRHSQEYETPTAFARLLGTEMTTSPIHSRTPSYYDGNSNLVHRSQRHCDS